MLDEEYVGARQKAMLALDEVLGYEVLTVIHNEDATDVKLDVVMLLFRLKEVEWRTGIMISLASVGMRNKTYRLEMKRIALNSSCPSTACWGFWRIGRVARCVVGPDACVGGSMLAWWARVSGVSVWRVRAVGACGEGHATCIGGRGVAGRDVVDAAQVMWGHMGSHGVTTSCTA